MALRRSVNRRWSRSRVPRNQWSPTGCWALETSVEILSGLSRVWSVGGGRCRPSRACWSVRSTATALSSAWWGHQALARAVWCVPATGVLVETLLDGGVDGDIAEAEAAITRLAAAP